MPRPAVFNISAPTRFRRAARRCRADTLILATSCLTLLAISPSQLYAQDAPRTGVIAGSVVSAQSARPLPGAQLQIVGTQQGTVADDNGRFRLNGVSTATPTVSVVVRLIGFSPRTVALRVGDTEARVELTETAATLDQVVVTGTAGATQIRALGNAVSQVSAADVMQAAPVADVSQLLNARVTGLTILPASGNVGTGGSVRVRGVASLSLSNEPLLYIDGVRANNSPDGGPNIRQGRQTNRLNDINPEDIESIEVIKGPAAATLYGTEASSGVIQIITKKGRAGAPGWDFAIKQGTNWLMDPAGKVPTVYSRDAVSGVLSSVNLYQVEKAAGRNPFSTGRTQSYLASLRGGVDKVHYYISGDWDDNNGIVSYNWQKKYSVRTNLSIVPSNKVTVNGNLGFTRSNTRYGQAASGWDLWGNIVWGSPSRLTTPTRGFLRVTPEAAGEIETYSGVDRFTGSVQMNYNPVSWLANRLTIGADVGTEGNSILFPRNPAGSAYFFGALSLGQKSVEEIRNAYNTADYSATATFDLPSILRGWTSATSAGAQYYSKRQESVTAVGQQFPAPSVTTIGGAAVTTSGEDLIENKTVGLYLQEQMSRNNRLFLTAAVRGDDNSAFGENFSAAIYPKFSASWVVSEESFFKLPTVSSLKLRGAFGYAGKQPDVFAARRLYQPATGPGNISVLTPQAIGNPDLKPEVGQELELGFDATLLDNRVDLNLSYYKQNTKDAIVQRRVPPSEGFPGFQFVNVGEVENHGLEVASDIRIIERPTYGWRVGVNYARNQNKVVDLGGLPPISVGSGQENREGSPIGAFFAKKVVSATLDATGKAQNILCDNGSGGTVACATAPRVYWGTPTPTWQGSVNTNLTFLTNFRLYALVDFRGGHMTAFGDIGAMHTTFRNSKAINEGTDPILMAYDQLGLTDQAGYFDAGFAKLREISLNYTAPGRVAQKLRASSAALNVAVRNLSTFWVAQSDIFGEHIPDPEVRTPAAGLSAYVQTVVPPLSQFVVTLRLAY